MFGPNVYNTWKMSEKHDSVILFEHHLSHTTYTTDEQNNYIESYIK